MVLPRYALHRYGASDRELRWILLTSHNVSKAAWGEVQNIGKHTEGKQENL